MVIQKGRTSGISHGFVFSSTTSCLAAHMLEVCRCETITHPSVTHIPLILLSVTLSLFCPFYPHLNSTHTHRHRHTHHRYLIRVTSCWQSYKAHLTMNPNVRSTDSISGCWLQDIFFSLSFSAFGAESSSAHAVFLGCLGKKQRLNV